MSGPRGPACTARLYIRPPVPTSSPRSISESPFGGLQINATDPVGAGVALDLLVAYLGTHSPLSPPVANRITTP
jgi:hypothetical protein